MVTACTTTQVHTAATQACRGLHEMTEESRPCQHSTAAGYTADSPAQASHSCGLSPLRTLGPQFSVVVAVQRRTCCMQHLFATEQHTATAKQQGWVIYAGCAVRLQGACPLCVRAANEGKAGNFLRVPRPGPSSKLSLGANHQVRHLGTAEGHEAVGRTCDMAVMLKVRCRAEG